jgi:hypothetical protein
MVIGRYILPLRRFILFTDCPDSEKPDDMVDAVYVKQANRCLQPLFPPFKMGLAHFIPIK